MPPFIRSCREKKTARTDFSVRAAAAFFGPSYFFPLARHFLILWEVGLGVIPGQGVPSGVAW